MRDLDRRAFLAVAGLGSLGASGLLTGCGTGGGSGTAIRYAWWGTNVRQRNYTKALKAFDKEHADIGVEPEFAAYTAFQERMTTQMAARNVSDIFWIGSAQVMTYHKSGIYRRLDDIPTLDLSDYSDDDIATFELKGELNTMPHGVFVPVLRYNETLLGDHDTQLPEDWTWDAIYEFLLDYSSDNPDGIKGTPYTPDQDMAFEAWLRQHGQDLWTEDGDVGFDAEVLAEWLEWWRSLQKEGGALTLSEQEGMLPDWGVVGDKVLMKFGSSNHIIDEAEMFPDDTFRLRPVPAADDAAAGHKFLYYPRLAIYAGMDDGAVEAAGRLVDFNVNNVEFLRTVGMTMGAPPNPRLLKKAYDFASEVETEMLSTVEAERDAERRPRYEAPAGTSTWREAMTRAGEQVALGEKSVAKIAEGLVSEIRSGIEQEK